MPTPDHGLTVTGLAGQAGSFRIGPIDLHAPADRVLVILGPSGAGKTMLLETIAGLRPQQSGQIRLAGTDLTTLPPERRRIGLVFQDAALFPHLSVKDNVAFGPRASRQAPGADATALLRRLGISHLSDRSPRSLSGGERQRVALARALAITPGLLLLDEPLSALDQPTREDMRTLLQELLADLEIPAVHVTHDRDEALSIGDDLAIIVGRPAPPDRASQPGRRRTRRPRRRPPARLVRTRTRHHRTPDSPGRPAPPPRCRTPGHPRTRAHLLPARRRTARPASSRHPGRRQPYRADRAVLPTRPLARISLASDPPVTALMLHRDLEQLDMQAGTSIGATLPPGGIRIFPAT